MASRHGGDIGCQCAQLVAIGDLNALSEVAGGDLVELRFDFFDRPE